MALTTKSFFRSCISFYRFYTRRISRKPINIFKADRDTKSNSAATSKTACRTSDSPPAAQSPCSISQITATHGESNIIVKLDKNDCRFGPAILRTKSKNQRYKYREILLEGHRLILDALDAKMIVKAAFVCDKNDGKIFVNTGASVYFVSKSHMKVWSDMDTPPGIMAVFEMPLETCNVSRDCVLPLTLICDNIRDPGNMGTIIRLAAAAQCDKVLLPKGCVDVWEPKVLRSAMGCHFRVPLYGNLTWGNTANHLDSTTMPVLADVCQNLDTTSETNLLRHRDNNYSENIDLPTTLSIKNVANTTDFTTKQANVSKSPFNSLEIVNDYISTRNDTNADTEYKHMILKVRDYYNIDYTAQHHTLVVCNEATGPSDEARKLVYDKYGEIVTIPSSSSVQSLNSAIAAAVIVFEAKRQIDLKLIRNVL